MKNSPILSIQSTHSSAQLIPEYGATICSLKFDDRELLYLHDFFWDKKNDDLGGGWPFLFPVCARLSRDGKYGVYQYLGNYYQLPIHGFSWYLPWQVLDHQKDSVHLKLVFDETTLKMYPFQFEIELKYFIHDRELHCQQIYRNLGDHPMPFYAGFHPYFLIPSGVSKHQVCIEFHSRKRFIYNENLTDICQTAAPFSGHHSIDEKALNESLSLIDDGKAARLIFPDYRLSLNANRHKKEDFPYLQLYHIPEKPFFCMEPWMGFPNALNSVTGAKWLQPGETMLANLTLVYERNTG